MQKSHIIVRYVNMRINTEDDYPSNNSVNCESFVLVEDQNEEKHMPYDDIHNMIHVKSKAHSSDIGEKFEDHLKELDVEYLIFSGGGGKGMAFCGTLLVLEEYVRTGLLTHSNIKGCAGTSIGCVFALMYILRTRCKDLFRLLFDEHLLDDMEPEIDINQMYSEYGLDRGERMKSALLQLMQTSLPDNVDPETLTYIDLYKRTGKRLTCTATNITCGCISHLSHETVPDMFVWQGVMASMAVPLLFKPIHYAGHMYVDGAVVDNLPINTAPNDKILAFKLANPIHPKTVDQIREAGFSAYIQRIFECGLEYREQGQIDREFPQNQKHKLIIVDSGCIGTLHFTFSRKEQVNTVLKGMISTHHGMWKARLGMLFGVHE